MVLWYTLNYRTVKLLFTVRFFIYCIVSSIFNMTSAILIFPISIRIMLDWCSLIFVLLICFFFLQYFHRNRCNYPTLYLDTTRISIISYYINPWTQLKVKEQGFNRCSTFHSHSRLFNNEHKSFPKMIETAPNMQFIDALYLCQ